MLLYLVSYLKHTASLSGLAVQYVWDTPYQSSEDTKLSAAASDMKPLNLGLEKPVILSRQSDHLNNEPVLCPRYINL